MHRLQAGVTSTSSVLTAAPRRAAARSYVLRRYGPRAAPAAWLLGLVTVLGAALRFTALGSQSYWLDEWFTWSYMQASPIGMLRDVYGNQALPPLYFCVAWVWVRVFGSGELGLRSLSALAGSATVPLVYAAARPRLKRRAALFAAQLVAVNPFAVWYSQEARPYELFAALAALSLLGFVRTLDGRGGRWAWTWAIASALALMTHFFAVFFVVPQAAWLVKCDRGRTQLRATAVVVAAGLLMLPLAVRGAGGSATAWVHTSAPLATRLFWVPVQFLAVPNSMPWNGTTDTAVRFIASLALCAGGLALGAIRPSLRGRLSPFWLVAVATIALPLLIAYVRPSSDYFLPRYVIAALAPLLVIIAAGFTTRRPRMLGALAGIALAGLSLSMTISIDSRWQLQRIDWRTAGRLVGAAREPRAVITAAWIQSRPLTLYAPRLSSLYFQPPPGVPAPEAKPHRVVTVRQIALVSYAYDPWQGWWGLLQPGNRVPHAGFRLTGGGLAHGFLVRVYTSSKPLRTDTASLIADAAHVFGTPWAYWTEPAVFIQRPSP